MKVQDFEIVKGKTFRRQVRWETTPIVYAAITAITAAAPCMITAPDHGVPNGWKVAVVTMEGMRELQAKHNPPRGSDYHVATRIDEDTIELNGVNSTEYQAYVSGGYVQYYSPQDLTGYTARMTIKDAPGGTALLELTTENVRIIIDAEAAIIELLISAEDTAAIDWWSGVYDLELVSDSNVVTGLLTGAITVTEELTTEE